MVGEVVVDIVDMVADGIKDMADGAIQWVIVRTRWEDISHG
uniref:Uncharacterized protein n=1 Tax=Acrobeloides nanus TaxID=290746 RepID=A0A914ESK4_9BILA